MRWIWGAGLGLALFLAGCEARVRSASPAPATVYATRGERVRGELGNFTWVLVEKFPDSGGIVEVQDKAGKRWLVYLLGTGGAVVLP